MKAVHSLELSEFSIDGGHHGVPLPPHDKWEQGHSKDPNSKIA